MRDILCKIFGFLKYILLIASFGLVFYGIIVTYGRLEKPLIEAIPVFIPFGFVLVMFIITLITRSKSVRDNLFFNFVAVFVFLVTIIICLRAMFDTNMILFHKYGINYNPAFFSDNLSSIEAMLYMLGVANLILIICGFLEREKPKKEKNLNTNINKNDKKNEDGEKIISHDAENNAVEREELEKKDKNNDKDFFEDKKEILEETKNIDKDTEEILETKDED